MRLLTFSFLKNCKRNLKMIPYGSRMASSILQHDNQPKMISDPNLVEISPSWSQEEEPELRAAVLQDMQVYPDFITQREEEALMMELEPQLRRMRYEFDHWDNAIQGFRETERSQWSEESSAVLARVRGVAFGGGVGVAGGAGADPLPHAHVLDLAPGGHIKPHIDAVRFCGDVIAGLCLVSTAVMQLVHNSKAHLVLNALLAQRALYIMKGAARYEFTHAVLGSADSSWRGARVPRRRRVALICRSKPAPAQPTM